MHIKRWTTLAIALSSCLSPGPPPGETPHDAPRAEGRKAEAPATSAEDRAVLLERLKQARAAAGNNEPSTMPNVDRIVDGAVREIVKGKRKVDAIVDVALRDAVQSAGRDCKAWWLSADSLDALPFPRELVTWSHALVSFGVVKAADESGKTKYFVLIFAPDPSVQRGGYEIR